MPDTFNYFSHQKFTPNYIHGIDGEYENVSSATTSATCTAVTAVSNVLCNPQVICFSVVCVGGR